MSLLVLATACSFFIHFALRVGMSFRSFCIAVAVALSISLPAHAAKHFNRIASFPTYHNMAVGEDTKRTSSAEIIAASADGQTLIYTDSPLGVVGLIDISNPSQPKPLGNLDMQGEPTAVSVIGQTAFVAVNTSESYTQPSGQLRAIDLQSKQEIGSCDLRGQPDSTAKSPDGSLLAIAIENERDEDLGDGRIPQMPAGLLVLMEIRNGVMDCNRMTWVNMSGIATIGSNDPEPEFVDINHLGETVVTLQENNHLAVVNRQGEIISHFSAGSVNLTQIDTLDDRASLDFTGSQSNRLREPDGVQWLNNNLFAIANEGDMDGGSRGMTIFHKDGTLLFESGASFEHAVVQIGHYPDKRSDAKGVEPEGMEFAHFEGTPFVFLLSERASVIGVYDVSVPTQPLLTQLLPSGISPEGVIAIPERNLLATANEADLVEDGGARAHVMIYEYQDAPAQYPTLTSAGAKELIGWGANSGMVAGADGMIYAVNDSFYGYQPSIFVINPRTQPAQILRRIPVTRAGHPAQKLDLEGITTDGKGGFWLASEGRTDRLIPHALYHVNASGEIQAEVSLPEELLQYEIRFGFEGITRVGDWLWMAVQREWKDDPKGLVKLVAYNTQSKEWGAIHYPLDSVSHGWIGLSEINAFGDYVYLIERDNQIGEAARIKQVTRVPISQMVPAKLGETLPVVTKEVVRDLIPDLQGFGGYVVDKVEGLAITPASDIYVSTDNDGVDDSSGETFFWSIGKAR